MVPPNRGSPSPIVVVTLNKSNQQAPFTFHDYDNKSLAVKKNKSHPLVFPTLSHNLFALAKIPMGINSIWSAKNFGNLIFGVANTNSQYFK